MKVEWRHTFFKLVGYFKAQEELPIPEERDALWRQIEKGIRRKQIERRIHRWSTVSAAAVFMGLLFSGVLFYWKGDHTVDIVKVADRLMEQTDNHNEIQLILSGKETITVGESAKVVNSQSGRILVNEKRVEVPDSRADAGEYTQLVVPKGRHMHMVLADGSSLFVNSGTKVVYPRVFRKGQREIYVNGEIFIDVHPDKSAPFIVKTDRFEIEVLGTAFNVNAYREDAYAEVTLMRGAVKLTDSRKQIVELLPDQQVNLSDGGLIGKKQVEAWKYSAWTEGLLVLEGEPIQRVFDRLSRYYGESIVIDVGSQALTIRGMLDLNCPLDEVLDRISVIAPINVVKTSEGYCVTEK